MDEILKFIKSNPKHFQHTGPNSGSWHNVFKDGEEIGYIWFKNLLGGWNIKLEGQEMFLITDLQVLKHLIGYTEKTSLFKRFFKW